MKLKRLRKSCKNIFSMPDKSRTWRCRAVLHIDGDGVNLDLAPVLRLKNSGNDHQALV
jgi:hypothetical protein